MDNEGLKEKIGDYFNFSVNERWAVLVLVILILVLFVAPRYFTNPEAKLIIEDSLLQKAMATIDSAPVPQRGTGFVKNTGYSKKGGVADRFFFDPNSVSFSDLVRLGVKEKTAQTITKYRDKGGKFRTAADLERIYGLSPDLIQQLKPFVRIRPADTPQHRINYYENKRKTPAKIKINFADSTAWEGLPGIGPKLASRIINYRKRLGGFYSINQVAEVYGLQDSTFKKIESLLETDEHPVTMLLLNSATRDEMSTHPYFRNGIANAIEQYRTAHGRFEELADLKKIHLIDEGVFEKISRYCKID